AAGALAAPYLAERLKPTAVPAEKCDKLLADLDSDDFDARTAAAAELEKLGGAAVPPLERLLAGRPPAEPRRRPGERLAKGVGRARAAHDFTPEQLREQRAVEVLEGVDRPEARNALDALARGAADLRLLWEARAALARLARRQ